MTLPAAQKTKSSCLDREHLLQLEHRATQEKHNHDSQLKLPWEESRARDSHGLKFYSAGEVVSSQRQFTELASVTSEMESRWQCA